MQGLDATIFAASILIISGALVLWTFAIYDKIDHDNRMKSERKTSSYPHSSRT
ncbi:MAG: hypothetical protein HZA34_04955 [Candidatus Pacebacteria bacterium]|nr:hypothetical protein [Candidatus Paceibacterota bacterium]